ncbi:MAG: sulfotransferase family protein, partial [Polyangiales bacterium]
PQRPVTILFSQPRAGSTLLQRMLAAHPAIHSHPEPHLLTPLAHLGYYANVERAPYDHLNAAQALRLFVQGLPGGEADYLDALRAYTDTLYGRHLAASSRQIFLDKTPAYALILPFLRRLYPDAHYLVLTRHPLAVFSSYAGSFFEGDWDQALAFNPILDRYVPAISALLRERPHKLLHLHYSALVQAPEEAAERIFHWLGLEHHPGAVDYGASTATQGRPPLSAPGRGDPFTVSREQRPVTDSLERWAAEVQGSAHKSALARAMLQRLDPADLHFWGGDAERLLAPLAQRQRGQVKARPWNRYRIERAIFLALRRDIHKRPHGRLLKRLRYYCDVLLRDAL